MGRRLSFRIIIFVLMFSLIAAVQVYATARTGDYLAVERHTLANGLTVLIKNRPSGGQVLVEMLVRTGSYNEEDQFAGISHFLEHMVINRGTENLAPGDLPKAVDRIGGEQNGGTGQDNTSYYIQGGSTELTLMLDLMAEMCFRPVFAQDQIDEERPVIEEELLRMQNSPATMLYEQVLARVFQGTNYARSIGGSIESLARCDSQAFYDYHGRYYHPNNMVLVLAGDVQSAEALPLVDEIFGGFAPGEIPEPLKANVIIPAKPVVIMQENRDLDPGTAQAMMAYYIPPTGIRDSAALDILAEAYGGGTYSILREAYMSSSTIDYIECNYYEFRHVGMFALEVYGPASKIKSFERSLKTSTKRLFNQVEKGRLESAKQRLLTWFAFSTETLSGLANRIGVAELNGDIEHYQKYLQVVKELTATDVKNAAKKYINTKSYILLIQFNPAK